MSRRPEGETPPELYYDQQEALQYSKRSRLLQIQTDLAARCLELIELKQPSYILDIGCGTGLSGDVLTAEGHEWVGIDIAPAMLKMAMEEGCDGDLILGDIGQRQGFRDGVFDGAISVSVLQWLCYAFTSEEEPRRRLRAFFEWLYSSMSKGAKAALQFYPSHDQQTEMIGKAAKDAGFTAGFVVDNPDSEKKKKIFLLLSVGAPLVSGGTATDGSILRKPYGERGHRKKRQPVKSRDWILAKKEQQRAKNMTVRPDTRYTGRKRKDPF